MLLVNQSRSSGDLKGGGKHRPSPHQSCYANIREAQVTVCLDYWLTFQIPGLIMLSEFGVTGSLISIFSIFVFMSVHKQYAVIPAILAAFSARIPEATNFLAGDLQYKSWRLPENMGNSRHSVLYIKPPFCCVVGRSSVLIWTFYHYVSRRRWRRHLVAAQRTSPVTVWFLTRTTDYRRAMVVVSDFCQRRKDLKTPCPTEDWRAYVWRM